MSDRETTPSGSGIDEDTLQLLQVIFKSYKPVPILKCMIQGVGYNYYYHIHLMATFPGLGYIWMHILAVWHLRHSFS